MSEQPSELEQKLGAVPTHVEIDGEGDGELQDLEVEVHDPGLIAYMTLRGKFMELSARNEKLTGEFAQFLGRITGLTLRWEERAASHDNQLERMAAARYVQELGAELRKALDGELLQFGEDVAQAEAEQDAETQQEPA